MSVIPGIEPTASEDINMVRGCYQVCPLRGISIGIANDQTDISECSIQLYHFSPNINDNFKNVYVIAIGTVRLHVAPEAN